ncbi:hypothetical protein PTSG_08232 [Salpingoeca rosetta]|uniref:Transmembrane protein 50A n=1 Tax=Salpingoeca rosetta (strain ATCC 50818 / BSB-021) TaxID=946362 RepID=F2UID6_SALR5|nr:uncharacterized protein PTSG_08232 [Salpingoeca rosetta]EGD76885.1 hypothetical protein PTSG_08232 [Salpingoeca rosetta]|eukprot:XP_004991257.1 hypothetical protein PTSG_08232 [Salpingoeca rosetta]
MTQQPTSQPIQSNQPPSCLLSYLLSCLRSLLTSTRSRDTTTTVMASRGCLDEGCENCCTGCGECCPALAQYRNPISSVAAGILFAVGWWFMIDGTVNDSIEDKHQAIGVMSTLGLFMVNAISAEMLSGDVYTDGCLGTAGARVWLLLGLVMSFGSLIAATWVMIEQYIKQGQDYAGACVFLQNSLIFISSLVFKFGRGSDSSW